MRGDEPLWDRSESQRANSTGVRVRIQSLRGEAPAGASLRVLLLDNSKADTAPVPVASVKIDAWTGAETVVDLDVPNDWSESLAVFAHVGRTDEFEIGDWLTTTAYIVQETHSTKTVATAERSHRSVTIELDRID